MKSIRRMAPLLVSMSVSRISVSPRYRRRVVSTFSSGKKRQCPFSRFPSSEAKHARRIESRKAKPIHAPVATHQRARLRITEKPVVLDFCMFFGHLVLPLRARLPAVAAYSSPQAAAKAGSAKAGALPLIRIPTLSGAVACAVSAHNFRARRESAEDIRLRQGYGGRVGHYSDILIPSPVSRSHRALIGTPSTRPSAWRQASDKT